MKTDIFPADSNSNLNDLITAILLRLKSFGLSKLHVGVMRLRRLLTVLIAGGCGFYTYYTNHLNI